MSLYQNELNRIRKNCYSNKGQIAKMIRTRRFIDENSEKDLNLDLLSNAHYTSKFHLLRLFKRYYGIPPKQYLTDKRIERSKEYLKEGRTVSGTCYSVGFESPGSFSTLFKRKHGITPTEYQKEQFSRSRYGSNLRTLKH